MSEIVADWERKYELLQQDYLRAADLKQARMGKIVELERELAAAQTKLASITATLEQATNSVVLSAKQIEQIGDDFKRSGCDTPELRKLCLQGMSAIALKRSKLQHDEAVRLHEELDAAEAACEQRIVDALQPTKNIIATYDPPTKPNALLHDQVFAVLQRLEAKLARIEAAGRELPKEPIGCPTMSKRFIDYVSELRDYAIAQKVRADENELDARRYRNMRASARYEYRNGPGIYWYLPRWNRDLPVGERLDAAIDAAIKEQT